jgi:preprotein translocase subunit YajC
VVTIGGVYAKVVDMNEQTVLLQIDGAKFESKNLRSTAGEASEEDVKSKS